MQSCDKNVQEFLQSVCREIRFKGIHKRITRELSDHIEDQKHQYIKQGLDEETAVLKAVEQMGDPVVVGKQLDKTHRPKTEWSMLSLAAILVVIGGIVQFLLSSVNAGSADRFSSFLLYAPMGIVIFVIAYFFDYTLFGWYSKLVYFTIFAITASGFLFFTRSNGAYIHVYYSVLLFIPAFAGILYGLKNKGYPGIICSGLFYGGIAFMCILAPSSSSLLLLTVSCLIILTVSIAKGFFGANKKISLAMVYIPALLMFILTVVAIAMADPHRLRRIVNMINPENDPSGSGWQHLMIRRLVASSRPMGKAVLEGPAATMRFDRLIPGWSTDFSLTYIIARFGYIVGMAIVAIMIILIVRMFSSVLKQKGAYGFLLSFSVSIAITGQIVLYVLSNTGMIAPLAVNFPFISFGAYGFIVNMALMGILLSVYRRTGLADGRLPNVQSNAPLFSLADGKLIIDLGFKSTENPERKKYGTDMHYKNH